MFFSEFQAEKRLLRPDSPFHLPERPEEWLRSRLDRPVGGQGAALAAPASAPRLGSGSGKRWGEGSDKTVGDNSLKEAKKQMGR